MYSKTETSKTYWSNGALPLHWDQAETQMDLQEIPVSSHHSPTEIHVTDKEQIPWDAQGFGVPKLTPHNLLSSAVKKDM